MSGDIRVTNPSAPAESDVPAAKVVAVGNIRWLICGLLFASTAINYMDRQILGLLKNDLSHDLGWNERSYANIVTAFQFAYALGYLFAGRMVDRFGVKRALPLAATLWSIAAFCHGFARTVGAFSVARLALGLTEGANFPAAIKTVSEWFPVKERALATGIFNCGSTVGAIFCPLLVPWLAARFGWPMAFFVTGASGAVWVVFWMLLYESPERHRLLSTAERSFIGDNQPAAANPSLAKDAASDVTAAAMTEDPEDAAPVSWRRLLSFPATWAYLLASILAGPVWWFYLFWIPDFFQKRFHLTLDQIKLPVAAIYAMTLFGSVGGGWLSSSLIARGWSVNKARKTALLICAVCVIPVFGAASVTSLWVSVLLVGLAASAHQGWSANLYTFTSDTMPKKAVSSLVGLGGLVSGLVSMVVAQVVGAVLTATGSYVPLFIWASTMYLLSLAVIQILVPQIRQANDSSAASREGRPHKQ